ncbi:hypothetical protein LINPERHAP2_LOCUS24064 [Linum perenne]
MRFIDYIYVTIECVVLFMFLIISFVLYDLILFIYVYCMSNLTKLDFVALIYHGYWMLRFIYKRMLLEKQSKMIMKHPIKTKPKL